jgi:hypothetical protein
MPAPAIVLDLVERFHQHLAAYKQNSYNEEQLRIEFLNPMFAGVGLGHGQHPGLRRGLQGGDPRGRASASPA